MNDTSDFRKTETNKMQRAFGFPSMLLFLILIFWLTIKGANYPSQLLSEFFAWLEIRLYSLSDFAGLHKTLESALIEGVYGMLSKVISVMLPPMLIFFPLFTLLNELGFLPRIAVGMDSAFRKSGGCGQQCLTMMMGFGCNACGVTECRAIESKRERLIAIITNSFVPCNGKFPALIAFSAILFAPEVTSRTASLFQVITLALMVILSVVATLLASKALSLSILKGTPSPLTQELPPIRRPQISKVIVYSVLSKTKDVLLRAVFAAAPAGLILWLLTRSTGETGNLLSLFTDFLDPFASLIGMDGVILAAFILALPANEMVVPVMLMAYSMNGTLADYSSISELGAVLMAHGWSKTTAVCTLIFSLFHFPCATTLLTIKKETGSLKWTALAFLIPTACGLVLCFIANSIATALT